MSEVIIQINNLGKKYRLGTIGTGTLSQDLNRWWARYRGKEDPYSKVDEDHGSKSKNSDYWALKNLSFEVKQGEILGIIGKNGAGKSTLLKLLSRVTAPTTGEIKVKGRIASLLEVGTGFHPELTGKENVFLNGAILGMTKKEIKLKLDEIVAFSGVEQYIDTPVKRYSSGMYVRLAFAVAAHLEPEILIVDEVLAVGDAEFQKKCINKMSQVAKEGRTILFVSHTMDAVESLCTRGIVLNSGSISYNGKINEAINHYISKVKINDISVTNNVIDLSNHPNKIYSRDYGLQRAEILVNGQPTSTIYPGDDLKIKITYKLKTVFFNPVLGVVIKSPQDQPYIGINNKHTAEKLQGDLLAGAITVSIPNLAIFGSGQCGVDLYFGDNEDNFDTIKDAFFLNLKVANIIKGGDSLNPSLNRVFQPQISFTNEPI